MNEQDNNLPIGVSNLELNGRIINISEQIGRVKMSIDKTSDKLDNISKDITSMKFELWDRIDDRIRNHERNCNFVIDKNDKHIPSQNVTIEQNKMTNSSISSIIMKGTILATLSTGTIFAGIKIFQIVNGG